MPIDLYHFPKLFRQTLNTKLIVCLWCELSTAVMYFLASAQQKSEKSKHQFLQLLCTEWVLFIYQFDGFFVGILYKVSIYHLSFKWRINVMLLNIKWSILTYPNA